ncbi:hypothetical protein FHR38_001930 [Micromonospora polyrhachis]|uniref:Uncharacterized protein n=1 Tax=Micromonospora polyrhachis TaxID=1282883 RepID=A0A7W7SPY3_9ACTN|nr:hypothetical protein [Micromonospora polyrhachis]
MALRVMALRVTALRATGERVAGKRVSSGWVPFAPGGGTRTVCHVGSVSVPGFRRTSPLFRTG